MASSSRAAGTSDSSQSEAITLSSTSAASATSAATPITVSSDPVFYGMAALPEEDVRSDTVQEVSSDVQEISSENAEQSDEGLAILEAENDAARLAADAAAARLRLLRARASSSRTSARSLASAVSRASRRPSDISHEVLEHPGPLLPPPPNVVAMQIPAGVEAHPQAVPAAVRPRAVELPIANADVAATGGAHDGRHRPQVPHQLTEMYIQARDQVGNMGLAMDFWRAREQLHAGQDQPLRDDGAGVWTPEYSAGGTDIHQRAQELEARIRMMSDQRRSAAPGSPAASFASAMTANAPPHDAHSPHLRDLESHKPKALPGGRDRAQRARQTVAPTMVNISTPVPPAVAPPPGLGATQVEPDYFEDYFEDIDEEIPQDYVIENQAVGRGPTPPPSSSSSSSTSSSSSSGAKKKKKLKKKKSKITVPYKVKAGEIKLPAWPTATGFPAWRRTLRQAVISASDRPERARPWIFAVEADDASMEDLHCADSDRHRTLDAKLAEALTKILKGEPARKVALAAERAALHQEVLGGRQCLLLIYQEFKRTEAKTDAASYSNLESIRCGPSDNSLEAFITLWENLLLTFRVQPSQDHLFTVFMSRVKHIPGLATTMAHLKRIPYGHADKNLQFLKDACTGLIEEIRTDRQLAEVAKVYKNGGTDIALVGMTEAEKKKAPCFALRDGKPCAAGGSCPYSHDARVIAEAKAKAKAKPKGKAKAAPKNGKGQGKGKVRDPNRPKGVCKFFNGSNGCNLGSSCTFLHERPAMAAQSVADSSPKAESGAPAGPPKGGQGQQPQK